LVLVPPLKSASLTAYQALKQLRLTAGLQVTMASIHLPAGPMAPRTNPSQSLQDCAQSFLGLTLHPVRLSAIAGARQTAEEIAGLARQLLENAVMLEPQPADRTH
jgi:hypothetical protein